MIADLFENKEDFRIVRIGEHDASFGTDYLNILKSKILTCEEMYPGIKEWLDTKVLKGLKTGERVGYIGFLDDNPVVTAVVKQGENAKFCHLKIYQAVQNSGLGDIFFSLMALEVRHSAKSIHFTLPEGLWESKKEFFNSFSFNNVVKCNHQYRLFEGELRSEASYSSIFKNVVSKLTRFNGIASIAGYSMDSKLVLSIQPKNAERIILGQKLVEIRRKFSKSWEGARFNIYATTPIKSLLGEARIVKVIEGTPEKIWENFEQYIGSTKEGYDTYVKGAKTVFALVLSEVKPYASPVPLEQIEYLVGHNLIAPQSYSVVGNDSNWMRAICMAAVLQGNASRKKSAIQKIA